MKLISMIDYVLNQNHRISTTSKICLVDCINYAKFLKQPLELYMFIPCDENNEPLEKPNAHKIWREEMGGIIYQKKLKESARQYQKAKERVLFEGYELCYSGMNGKFSWVQNGTNDIKIYSKKYQTKTIEDNIKYNLTLTPAAIKQIET